MRASAPDETLETTIDVLAVGGSALVGAAAGLAVALLLGVLLGVIGRRRPVVKLFYSRIRGALRAVLVIVGAAIAFHATTRLPSDVQAPGWRGNIQHGLLVAIILAATWMIASAAKFLEDLALRAVRERAVDGEPTTHGRRVQTQAAMLRRVGVVVIWIIGLAVVLLTFPGARAAGASVLASAGILSVVAGIAAQNSLSNLFAGIQLAFTDAIRVDDIVIVEGEFGYIEEITLTYVVVRVWDDRRLLLPSTHFTTNPFENWTRRVPQMLGTFELDVDWRVPVPALRAELQRLLAGTDMWDGRTGVLQVFDAKGGYVTLRVLVSAKDPGTLTDLRHFLREALVDYMQVHAPYALPRTRLEDIAPPPAARVPLPELDPEVTQELADELTELAALDERSRPRTENTSQQPEDPDDHRRREAAARRARRRAAREDRRRAKVGGGGLGRRDQVLRPEDTGSQTQVLSGEALAAALAGSISSSDGAAGSGAQGADEQGPQRAGGRTPADRPRDAARDDDVPDDDRRGPDARRTRTADGTTDPVDDRHKAKGVNGAADSSAVSADDLTDSPDEGWTADSADDADLNALDVLPTAYVIDHPAGPLRTSLLHRFDLSGVPNAPAASPTTTTAGHESSLFTGSPENEERRAAFSGPSQAELREREARAEQRRGTTGELDAARATGDLEAARGTGEPEPAPRSGETSILPAVHDEDPRSGTT